MRIAITDIVADHGSVVVFEGIDEGGFTVRFGADHRMAQAIVDALHRSEDPEAEVESWQFV